jgi:hypothetical protein
LFATALLVFVALPASVVPIDSDATAPRVGS